MVSNLGDKNQAGAKTPLSAPQKEAVEHGDGPLLVAAGAGSGKTRTLTERLLYLIENGVRPDAIVAITFTNKAANEMRKRVAGKISGGNAPFIGTFHSFGATILREEGNLLGRTKKFAIFDSDDSAKIMRRILKDSGSTLTPAKLKREISRIKNNLLGTELATNALRLAYDAYENELKRQNAFDFDDLIEKVVLILAKDAGVLSKHRKKYSHILVDEYQDINGAQYELLRLLGGEHKNINVVGDDQQSIYGFRWSDFTNFLNFENDWPDAKVVHLGENYRSSETIVRAAASVISKNKKQRHKELWTKNGEGEPIRVVASHSADGEAFAIVSDILKRAPFRHTRAVLYRTNAQSRAIEQALNSSGVPYDIFGSVRFYERKEIRDVVAAIRFASNPRDDLSRERIEKTFRKAVRERLISELPELGETLNPVELVGYVLKTSDYFGYLESKFENAEERIENIGELIRFAGGFADVAKFLERLSLLEPTDTTGTKQRGGGAGVNLMTIHLAKGLEFDDVYIAGASERLLPHEKSLYLPDELEEERRLMYVAMTRARKRLHISFYEHPSRFLNELPPELIDFEFVGGSADEFEPIIRLD